MKLVFFLPGFDRKSNGLLVLHELALELSKFGCNVKINPWSDSGNYYIPHRYKNLYDKENFNLQDYVAILPDSIPLALVSSIKSSASSCIWYLCNIPGLLGNDLYRFTKEDIIFSYSKQISDFFPQLYYHSRIRDLPGIKKIKKFRENCKKKQVAVYIGKGKIKPIHKLISKIIIEKNLDVIYITRFYPETKDDLYKILMESKFLISFDPISSTNYESTLCGTPVYLVNNLNHNLDLTKDFNIPLEGIFVDPLKFTDFINANNSLNIDLIHKTHHTALISNKDRVHNFFEFLKNLENYKSNKDGKIYNCNINQLYNKLLDYELPIAKNKLSSDLGSRAKISRYVKECIKYPNLACKRGIKKVLSRLFKKIKKEYAI